MTDAPKTIVSCRMDSGAVSASYIRTDAPELAALVEALRRGECPWREGTREHRDWFAVSDAALAAWDALLAGKP